MSELDELHQALEEARDSDQVASACVLYEEILTLDEEEDVGSTLLYAQDLTDLGNYGQALATLQRVEELVPDAAIASFHWVKGTIHQEMGDYSEAETCYREADQHESEGRGDYLVQAASMAFHRGEIGRAEFLIREALKKDCERDEALGNLGVYLASQRRFAEAKA